MKTIKSKLILLVCFLAAALVIGIKVFSLGEKSENFLPDWCFADNRKTRAPVDFSVKANQSETLDRIILVTLDTLRADHLGLYGYPRNISPFMDALAAHGILFQRAITSISTTTPAHASLFTALHPLLHNVLKNGHRLDSSFVTMAEQLRQQGYMTAGFVSTNRHFIAGNLHQGFDVFDEPSDHYFKYRRSRGTVSRAIAWLKKRRPTDEFFLWVHLFDPHDPYKTSISTCVVIKEETAEQRQGFVEYLLEKQHVDLGFYDNDAENMLKVINAYDAEIYYMDGHLRRLFHYVQDSKLASNTLWILVADHGEGLGNHGWMGHGKHIYTEQIHIPLIFYFSSGSEAGLKVGRMVELVDIFPTVMELIGGSITGQSHPVQGESLVPLFSGAADKYRKEFAFVQRRHYQQRVNAQISEARTYDYEEGEKYALLDGEYQYIWRTQGADELYCLKENPYEINNLIGQGLPQEKRLKDVLCHQVAKSKASVSRVPESVDPETLKKLKGLGYIQ